MKTNMAYNVIMKHLYLFSRSAISELFLLSNALTKEGKEAAPTWSRQSKPFRSQSAHFGAKCPFIPPIFAILRRRLNSYKYFFVILSVLAVLSCGTTQTGNGGLKVRKYDYAYEKTVFDDYRFEFEFHLDILEGDKKIEGLIKNLIYNGKDPDAYAADKESSVLEGLKKEDRPPRLEKAEDIPEGAYIESIGIKNYGDSFVILRRDDYAYYSGQAHGNSQIQYYILDADEARILSPDELTSPLPEDILKDNIASKFDIDFNYRKSLWPPDTISLEREGLLLFWNVYSIAPYSEGPIEITIPYSLASGYLTERARLIRDKLTK